MRFICRPVGIALVLCIAIFAAVGCGSSGDSGSATNASGDAGGTTSGGADNADPTKVGWLIFGPKNDAGFGQIAYEAVKATDAEFGSKLDNLWTDNVPVGKQATTITERYVADGAKMLIDTGAVGDLFLSVCRKHPDIHCIEATYVGTPPDNVSSYWSEWWKQEYLLGMAAGKLTKSNVIGYVQPYNIPLVFTQQNAWLLGCQKVNPDCRMRVVNINTWYDPPKTTQATNTLVDSGADVINSFVSDPSFCTAAEKRRVWAVGLYKDWSRFCPNGYINSAVWDLDPYFKDEIAMELDGTWRGGRMVYTKLGEGADLGRWGKNVPASVSEMVDDAYQDMVRTGSNPIRGPIYDTKGELRVKPGETLDADFLYTEWDWLVQGTIN